MGRETERQKDRDRKASEIDRQIDRYNNFIAWSDLSHLGQLKSNYFNLLRNCLNFLMEFLTVCIK
jgi:hypothetical protein